VLTVKTKTLFTTIPVLLILVLASTTHANGPAINLPTTEVTMQITYPVPTCYYIVTLSNVPPDYHVTNGQYFGWCVDEYHYIRCSRNYQAIMYSSYNAPPECADPDWDKVNYILNHKQGTPNDVQAAIWYFVNGAEGGSMPETIAGQNMVNDALANGSGFIPCPGQIIAVILYIDANTQTAIIELVVPIQNEVPEYPLGPILGIAALVGAFGFYKHRRSTPKNLP